MKVVKKGQDDSNLEYWISRTYQERLIELERIRQEVHARLYCGEQEFQRVIRIVKRSSGEIDSLKQ